MQRGLTTTAKIEQIEEYLELSHEDAYFDLISGRNNLVLIVDWRADDEEIIQDCEALLNTQSLNWEMRKTQSELGFELDILYKDQRVQVPFKADGADRDTTLITLNQILQADYEIRLCVASMGGDTIEFLPLAKAAWEKMQRRWGRDRLEQCFSPIDAESCFFG